LLVQHPVYSAAEYLQWSDQAVPDFDLIHEALKRPYAQMDGDYTQPYASPIPNFIAVRFVAQTLASRAQCYLLLGQPDKALDELTLLNNSRRLLENAPTGKPILLVSAMINVAVTALYVYMIADGLQSHAWQEPQLVALQEQLKKINLSPFVAEAFNEERASVCFMLLNTSQAELANRRLVQKSFGVPVKPKLEDPEYLFLTFAPRGWVFQNMVTDARLLQADIDSIDATDELVSPRAVNDAAQEMETTFKHVSPYNFIASTMVPNFAKACQVTAHNQTLVNEAQIACALERYHLAHGEYPETLEALAPQFMEIIPHDIIGGQPLHYRRTDDGKFLLYSVGWNETDDGGEKHQYHNVGRGVDYSQGDWVWQ
jgi:hypothetical protein